MSKLGGLGLGLLVLACVACSSGNSGGSAASGGGGANSSAGGSSAAGGSKVEAGGSSGSGTSNTATSAANCQSKTAATNSSGTLTPYSRIALTVTPSTFRVTTLNFVVTEDGDSRGPLLEMFAEVKNNGTKTECTFLPSIYLGGEELVGLVDTPPYNDGFSGATADCVGPGETGAIQALARGITQTELDQASNLSIDLEPNTYGTNVPQTNPPSVTAEIAKLASGYGVKGTVTPKANIYNYGVIIFPRNADGVLFAKLLAYPNNLGDLPAGTSVSYETDTTPCQFSDYELFDGWITRN